MTFPLADHSYGAHEVRLLKVPRRSDRHQVGDVSVSLRIAGDFAAAHTPAPPATASLSR
jgi:urate oxidase